MAREEYIQNRSSKLQNSSINHSVEIAISNVLRQQPYQTGAVDWM